MRWHVGILLVIALALNLYTSINSIGQIVSDNTHELYIASLALTEGWDCFSTFAHNNTSAVIGWLIPSLAKLFSISPEDVSKYILPVIFSITPLLVYFLYKRYALPAQAFIGALFFAVLPPTYLEVPTISKSTIAEPFAVGTLLVSTSSLKLSIRLPLASLFAVLTLWCHYTVGFLLLAWLGLLLIYNNRRLLKSIPLVTGSLFAFFYFSNASHGIIFYAMRYWQSMPSPKDDLVRQLLLLESIYNTSGTVIPDNVALSVIATSTVWQLWGTRIIIYLIITIMALGLYWLAKNRKMNENFPVIIGSAVLTILALFVPVFTKGLFLTRWIQIEGITLCLLYGYGSTLSPKWITYPLLGLLLVASLIIF